MRVFNKDFFLGLALGIAATLATVDLWALAMARQIRGEARAGIQKALGPLSQQPDLWKRFPRPRLPESPESSLERWSVQPLGGPPTTLGQLKGKAIFLNLWATWCAPCVAEMPSIENLSVSLRDNPVLFLVVTHESEETVRDFLRKHPLRVPVYLRDEDLPNELQTSGIPATFILDREGRVVYRHVGPANWDDEDVRKFIRSLRG